MDQIAFLGIILMCLLASIAALAWASRRPPLPKFGEVCFECGYSLAGLGEKPSCPECGRSSWLMREPRLDDKTIAGNTIERLGVAMIAPSMTAVTAALVTLCVRPASGVVLVTCVAAAPYALLALVVLGIYKRSRRVTFVTSIVIMTGIFDLLLAAVMYGYWTSPVQRDDVMWPITNIVLFSVVQLIGVIVLSVVLTWRSLNRVVYSEP